MQHDLQQAESSQQIASMTADSSALMSVIERIASNPDADLSKLEKMLDMQERIMNRNAEMAFNAAMAQMQGELPQITERGEIKHGNKVISTFAKFEDINEEIKPILQRHGFAVSFKTDTGNGNVRVTCFLTHSEGHRESTDIVLPSDTGGAKNAVQAVASSVSYGRRYTMAALLNISTGDDDDGVSAVQAPKLSDEQIANLDALIEETGADRQRFISWIGGGMCSSLSEVPATEYRKGVAMLEKKRKEQK